VTVVTRLGSQESEAWTTVPGHDDATRRRFVVVIAGVIAGVAGMGATRFEPWSCVVSDVVE
jgi:ABC-type branched-subunit amino acid transport system permease subunit